MASSATDDLLAGGGEHVEFARIGLRHDFFGQAEQAIGFARHRGRHHDDLVAGVMPFGDALRDVLDALGRAHRRAAVFMYD